MPAFRRVFRCLSRRLSRPAGLALLSWFCTAAGAQPAAPAAAASAPVSLPVSVPVSPEAMERARRDAANPMRVIMEAGRLRRRADGATPVVPVAAPPALTPQPRREAVRSTVADSPRGEAPALPASPPAARAAEPVLAPPLEPPPAVQPAVAEVLPAPPAPVELPTFIPAPDMDPPTLLQMVEPVIPPQVISRTGALREVTADLTLQPDGTVSNVVLAAGTPRAAQRYLQQALAQWRFAPMAAARVHRVQLVFDN
jgi:hypothetical protein